MLQTDYPGRHQTGSLLRKYRLEDGIELLKRAGIEVVFISMDNE